MIFTVAEVIAYASKVMTLNPAMSSAPARPRASSWAWIRKRVDETGR